MVSCKELSRFSRPMQLLGCYIQELSPGVRVVSLGGAELICVEMALQRVALCSLEVSTSDLVSRPWSHSFGLCRRKGRPWLHLFNSTSSLSFLQNLRSSAGLLAESTYHQIWLLVSSSFWAIELPKKNLKEQDGDWSHVKTEVESVQRMEQLILN